MIIDGRGGRGRMPRNLTGNRSLSRSCRQWQNRDGEATCQFVVSPIRSLPQLHGLSPPHPLVHTSSLTFAHSALPCFTKLFKQATRSSLRTTRPFSLPITWRPCSISPTFTTFNHLPPVRLAACLERALTPALARWLHLAKRRQSDKSR